ncbi:MAG: response regulator [Fibrobacteria bacterium]|nr:response regulator [Fibrobacteria bacterium]
MSPENSDYKDLKERNEKLREQFSGLLDSYAKLELTDLKRHQMAQNQKKLIDFIQRIARRLDDDDLLDILIEEFLIELQADRVSYILPGSGPSRRLAVSNEAVDKSVKRLVLPYFISTETDQEFPNLIYKCLDKNDLVVSDWKAPVQLVPDNTIQASLEHNFQMAMEEEFNVVQEVECTKALAYPIRTTAGGESVICMQKSKSRRGWSQPQMELFRDMCRYASLLLEQTQMTQQIRDLKDQLSSIIQSMPSAIIGMDLLGTITMWGGRAAELLEIPENEAMGKVFWELVPQYHFVADAMMDVISMNDSSGLNFDTLPFKKNDGNIIHHQATMFTMFGSDRGELALRIDDVTNQVELNNQLFHAQRMETVGTLAGGLAHDFNNVLGGIVGTISLMKERALIANKEKADDLKTEQDLEDIEIIESCTRRASDMVARLLSLSRKVEINMEPLELNHVVNNVSTLCKASFESRIKIETKIPQKKLWIMGDNTQLEQVILNMAVNARDAMKEGGTLGLQISEFTVTDKFRRQHPGCKAKKLACLAITDSGEGIPLKDLDKIFDPFYTTKSKEQGTGLGLAIVDKIIKEHNGFLEVNSKPGVNTAFSLYFNRIDAPSKGRIKTSISLQRGSGDVLVVDDDVIMRKTISRILYGMGYTVATASTGATAITMCESGLHFNLVILDVDMPVMSGLDIARIIRKTEPDMKILFCTGRQHQYQMQEVLSQKNTWLITKPFSREVLGKMVNDTIAQKVLK